MPYTVPNSEAKARGAAYTEYVEVAFSASCFAFCEQQIGARPADTEFHWKLLSCHTRNVTLRNLRVSVAMGGAAVQRKAVQTDVRVAGGAGAPDGDSPSAESSLTTGG